MVIFIIFLILALVAVGAYLFARSKSHKPDSMNGVTIVPVVFSANQNVSVRIESLESFIKDTLQYVQVVLSGISESGSDENIRLLVKLYKKKADGSYVFFTERYIDKTFHEKRDCITEVFRFRSFAEGIRVRILNARESVESDALTENREEIEK